MFRSKSLLCCKHAALISSNVATKSKTTSWTKKFNQENKCLFGDLIESQEQRRKRLLTEKDTSSNITNKQDELTKTSWYNLNMSIALDEVTDFPLINQSKARLKYRFKSVINFDYGSMNNNTKTNRIPSVSKILNFTMPEESRKLLEAWKKRMINELGEEAFELLNKAKLQQGVDFHDCIKKYLLGAPLEKLKDEEPKVSKLMNSLEMVLKDISNVSVIESQVVHSQLPYRGFVDCVAMYRGKPTLIEWKHSDKKKPYIQWTYDAPIQMSAYLGAINFDENYKLPIKHGMVIVAYSDGSPCDVFWLSSDNVVPYWKIWLDRLQQFISINLGSENEV